MATSSDSVEMIEVPVARSKTGVDVKQTLLNAEKVAREYASQDQEATKAVVAVASRILTDEKHKEVRVLTASTIAKMVLGALGEIPTDKLCLETEERVKTFMKGQPEKFLHIERGRNSGFHFIDRYQPEDLVKLQPKKANEAPAK